MMFKRKRKKVMLDEQQAAEFFRRSRPTTKRSLVFLRIGATSPRAKRASRRRGTRRGRCLAMPSRARRGRCNERLKSQDRTKSTRIGVEVISGDPRSC